MTQQEREKVQVVAERTILVRVVLPGGYLDPRDPLGELRSLAETAGANVVGELLQKRRKPHQRTHLGRGKVEELRLLAEQAGATLVIFENELSPAKIRNLEEALSCRVLDRSELILDIFANRARTHAARLQVEIAQLEYTYPRLRAMWEHLGQVAGGAPVGIGTRGPGEQQIEIDRRLVQRRLKTLRRELRDIQARKEREIEKRSHVHVTVGLVGYTNAGKSTLFNALTEGGAFVHEKLFATLSTRLGRWDLGGGNSAMLSDTVGFIRDLPERLLASFRSTLEETIDAHLLLIVVDASDPDAPRRLDATTETLDSIGACTQPRIIVLNKIDLMDSSLDLLPWLQRYPDAVSVSAVTGDGLDQLADRVREVVLGDTRVLDIRVPLQESRTIDFLEKRTTVVDRDYGDGFVVLRVSIGRRQVDQLLATGEVISMNEEEPRVAIARHWPAGDTGGQVPDRQSPHERFFEEESGGPRDPGTNP